MADQVGQHPEAAQDDDTDARAPRAKRRDEVAATCAGPEVVVEDCRVEGACADGRQRLHGRPSHGHVEVGEFKSASARLADQRIIVHHQDTPAHL
jgi:hypothetical protein